MGIEIRYGCAVSSLTLDDNGRVNGVTVRDGSGMRTVAGKSVILGCGGFEANVQMRTQHIGPLVGADGQVEPLDRAKEMVRLLNTRRERP